MAVFAGACRQRISQISDTLSSGADGHVSGTVDYDIFGEPVTETGVFAGSSGGSGGISALVFAYAGKPYDPVTGLSDYGFRDYASGLARFTTVDPIRDGSNWYAYCNSDPVNYVDAWGLCTSDKVVNSTSFSKTAIGMVFYEGMSIIQSSAFNATTVITGNKVTTFVSGMYAGAGTVSSYEFYGSVSLLIDNSEVGKQPLTQPVDNYIMNGYPYTVVGEATFETNIDSASSVSLEFNIDLLIKQDEGYAAIDYSTETVKIK